MNEHEAKFVKKILRTRKAEAMEWLRAETPKSLRVLGELEHESAVALVQRFYDAGAVKVLVIDIQDGAGGESANVLIVDLPSDVRLRKQLFKLQAEVVEPQGFEGDADDGDRYLFVGVK
jgi:hypothetical protein